LTLHPPARRASPRPRPAPAAARGANGSLTTSTHTGRALAPLESYEQAIKRVANQLQRISTESHLMASYAADGWKGAR
jgi:hypothetical protein